jgi:hypothetical protein
LDQDVRLIRQANGAFWAFFHDFEGFEDVFSKYVVSQVGLTDKTA